jgi:hypothetical protein
VALSVAQAAIGDQLGRQFPWLDRPGAAWLVPALARPVAVHNRRLRGLVELISIVQQQLARWPDGGAVRLSDGTLIGSPTTQAASAAASSPALPASASRSRRTGFV